MIRMLIALLAGIVTGCGSSEPPLVNIASDAIGALNQRIELLHRYVTFRRNYRELDFRIEYQNNSRGVPAPSDWDVRVVAEVPANELEQWIPAHFVATAAAQVDTAWLRNVPNGDRAAGVREWYTDGPNRVVGVDRERSIVAYRNLRY